MHNKFTECISISRRRMRAHVFLRTIPGAHRHTDARAYTTYLIKFARACYAWLIEAETKPEKAYAQANIYYIAQHVHGINHA